MPVSIVMRHGHDPEDRAYATEKFERLAGRFSGVHDIRVTLGGDGHHGPDAASADAVVHQLHSHFAVSAVGATSHAAIDLLLDKVDRQLAREKERVMERRGPTDHDT